MSKHAQQEIAAPLDEVTSDNATASAADDNTDAELKIGKENTKTSAKFFSSKRITKLAVFVAIALILKIFGKALTIMPTFTVTFVYLPWLISSISLGPVCGMIVAGISDILGSFIFGTPPIPLTFVSNTLFPLPIGLLFKFLPRLNDYVKSVLGSVISLLVCTLGLGSLALYFTYGYNETFNFFEYIAVFRLSQAAVNVINIVVLCALIKPLKRINIIPVSIAVNSDEKKYARLIGFVLTAIVLTALLIWAIIASALSNYLSAVTLSAMIALYIALMAITSLLLIKKQNKWANIANIIAAVVAFIALLSAMIVYIVYIVNSSQTVYIKYLIPIAVGIVAVLILTLLILRLRNFQGDKRK